MSDALEVPVAYFFPEADAAAHGGMKEEGATFMMDFLSTSEGLDLSRAFTRIRSPKLRRKVVELVRAIAENQPA
jgi:hypothetical protein